MRRVVAGLATLGILAVGLGACGGGSSSYKEPKGAAVATINFGASNFAFDPNVARIPPGIVDLNMKSTEGGHTLVIKGVSGFKLDAGGTGTSDSKKVKLAKGTYTFYCDLPGHREAGMEGKLTVG